MFITKADFATHIFEEAVATISRNDDTVLDSAISTATAQVARYLSRYDTDIIFAATGTDRDKYAELVTYVKDITKWHFIAVCNVQVDYEVSEKRYNAAIKELEKIRTGETVSGWPLLTIDATSTASRYGGNVKFNHYG